MRPGETPRAALLRIGREGGIGASMLLGFFVTNLDALETFIRGMKTGVRNFHELPQDNPAQELIEVLEALVLDERANAFADAPPPMNPFPELRPLPAGLTLTHVSHRPRFARTSEGVVLALDGISLIVPKKEHPGGYVYVGNTMHQLFSQDDMEALAGLLDAETALLTPEAGLAAEVPHAVD